MGDAVGGNTRFKGSGSLGKVSWRGKPLNKPVCCFEGFSTGIGGEFYEEAGGALPLVPATGFFVGALVGLGAVPLPTPGTIARNSGAAAEGWILDVIDAGSNTVRFRFTVFDGVGIAAQVVSSVGISLANVGGGFGDPAKLFVPVLAAFVPSGTVGPNGEIFIVVPRQDGSGIGEVSSPIPLGTPYVNNSPFLTMGVGLAGQDLSLPNCVQGIVGGTASWPVAFVPPAQEIYDNWYNQINAENRAVLVGDATVPISVVNTNGWRGDSALGSPTEPAPNPLAAFVGAPPLLYGGAGPPFVLGQECLSPMRLSPANIEYPFTTFTP